MVDKPPVHFVGPNKERALEPIPAVKKLLYMRLEALNEKDARAIVTIVRPETIGPLKKVFPELSELLDKGLKINGG